MDNSFLDHVDAQKGRWHDTAAEAKGISTRLYWIGRGRDAPLVAYRTAGTKPNATTIRLVWKQIYGGVAAPLLVVVAYPRNSRLNRKTETPLLVITTAEHRVIGPKLWVWRRLPCTIRIMSRVERAGA